MKKYVFSVALCLTMFANVANAQASIGLTDGVCLAQDDRNLYMSSPEVQSFIVIEKETGRLTFHKLPTENDCALVYSAIAKDGEAWFGYANQKDAAYLGHYMDGQIVETKQISDSYGGGMFALALSAEGSVLGSKGGWTIGCFNPDFSFDMIAQFEGKPFEFEYMKIEDMATDSHNNIWFSTALVEYVKFEDGRWIKKGIPMLYKIKDGRTETITIPQEFNLDFSVCKIEADAEGNIWIFSQRSMSDEMEWTNSFIKYNGKDFTCYDLPSEIHPIYDFKFDERGRLWMIQQNGPVICMENIAEGKYLEYNLGELPSSTSIFQLLVDGETVYLSGGRNTGVRGVSSINFLRPVLFTIKDGRISYTEIEADMDGKSITGVEQVNVVTDAQDNTMYDLQGRRVNGEATKGVYILNGKKVVKK